MLIRYNHSIFVFSRLQKKMIIVLQQSINPTMDKNAFKGLLEFQIIERQQQLWKAIHATFHNDPAYAKKDWRALNTLMIRKIRNGKFSE